MYLIFIRTHVSYKKTDTAFGVLEKVRGEREKRKEKKKGREEKRREKDR